MTKEIIALDGDGVLVDYHEAYARAWEAAFGDKLVVVDPRAYFALDRYGAPRLAEAQLAKLKAHMDADFWATFNPLPGAVAACHQLAEAGYKLVCVSALPSQYESARMHNLKALGFPIESVHAAPSVEGLGNPKVKALKELAPVAFVDDFLPYLHGVPASTHRALILGEPNGSPNTNASSSLFVDSTHACLPSFAKWWLSRYEG